MAEPGIIEDALGGDGGMLQACDHFHCSTVDEPQGTKGVSLPELTGATAVQV